MLSPSRLSPALFAAYTFAAIGCGPSLESPAVTYGGSEVIGKWEVSPNDAGAETAAYDASAGDPMGTLVASRGYMAGRPSPAPVSSSAGRQSAGGTGGTVATTPDNGSAGAAGAGETADAGAAGAAGAADGASGTGGTGGTAGTADNGSAGAGGDPAAGSSNAVTSVSFQVTTSPAGGRYQPKNIGAIWIENSSGKLVKTLEVWAAIRRRYLTGYAAALAGSTIDVTTSATLPRHQTHSVTWNLKDRSGAAVPPGSYRLRMELTDDDRTGNSNTVTFDTSQGPSSPTVADAPSFNTMTLDLR